ncbi:MAG: glyoxalase [Gammaproteobacteria bacterium]|nr:MAG: glyoxalase [Gammaproteobacteria bacterium]
MRNLNTVEIKMFVPAKNFELSKQFYSEMGFTLASDDGGVAYFYLGDCSFLLQDFYQQALAENFMMHLLVEDVEAWHAQLLSSNIAAKYDIKITELETQPWAMRDFVINDPSGIIWRIGQNI